MWIWHENYRSVYLHVCTVEWGIQTRIENTVVQKIGIGHAKDGRE